MREIKFRVWDKEGKEMIFPDGEWNVDSEYNFICFPLKSNVDTGNSEKYELMQYTNLKDKNGKEVYEGDILGQYDISIINRWSYRVIVWREEFAEFSAMYIDGSNGSSQLDESCNIWIECKYRKVIGNIYENPELIKGE